MLDSLILKLEGLVLGTALNRNLRLCLTHTVTGDFVNDYEGFKNPGDEAYSHLGGMFVADIDPCSGELRALRVIPTYMNQLSLKILTRCPSTLWVDFESVNLIIL
jgi:hypothetical protein